LESENQRNRELKQSIESLEEQSEGGLWSGIKRWTIGWIIDTTMPELKELRAKRDECQRRCTSLSTELLTIEQRLVACQTGFSKMIAVCQAAWIRLRWWIAWIGLLIVFGPFMGRLVKLVAAIVGLPKVESLRFQDSGIHSTIFTSESKRTVSVPLDAAAPLIVRANWIEERDETIQEKGRWIWRARSPGVSYAAGLVSCSIIKPTNAFQTDACLRLSSRSADEYLTIINLQPKQSLCLRPRAIVGLSDGIGVTSHWRIRNLHAWLFGQLRYLVFEGPGTIVIFGNGGLEASDAKAPRTRVAVDRVIGFEPQLRLATVASGTYRSYLFGMTPLYEAVLEGKGKFVRRLADPSQSDNLVTRTLGGFFNAAGKILGF